MNLDEMTLQNVEERLAALDIEVRSFTDVAQVEAATEEKKQLLTRKAELVDLEARKQTALELNAGKAPDKIVEERKADNMENKIFGVSSEEYRSGFLKMLKGTELNEMETRALTGGASVLPEQTANKVVERLVDTVPMLSEIDLFRLPGIVNVPVEVTAPGATTEATNAAVTTSTAALKLVALGGYNMNAYIPIGADLAEMSLSAFEDWLMRKISDAIAQKIEDAIINGSGVSEATGIEKYATWTVAAENAVDFTGSSGELLVTNLDAAIGLVPAAYDRDAKFLMSKKTFYNNVVNLTDVNNLPVVERDGRNFMVRGYPVVFSSFVTTGDIFFGDFKRGMVGNLGIDIKVEKQRVLAGNRWDYLGWAVFDCKPAAAGAIIKIAGDIAAS